MVFPENGHQALEVWPQIAAMFYTHICSLRFLRPPSLRIGSPAIIHKTFQYRKISRYKEESSILSFLERVCCPHYVISKWQKATNRARSELNGDFFRSEVQAQVLCKVKSFYAGIKDASAREPESVNDLTR